MDLADAIAMATRSGSSSTPPPWKRSNPRKKAGTPSKKLTAAQRQEARERARAAGRRYPNLVDNMAVASKRTRKTTTKKTVKKRVAKERAATKRTAKKR